MIEVQGLTKEYGRFRAVDDLSFRVAPGEVLGFLGPNGAGKTTTMRIVAGFLPATAGRVLVCGADIETQAVAAKRRIGYLPEGAPSYPEMTPRSFLEFIAERAAWRRAAPQRLDEVFALLHLGARARADDRHAVERLSPPRGPGAGDPARPRSADSRRADGRPRSESEARGPRAHRPHGEVKIIVISTHMLEEVEAVCNRAIIIARGKILADDTPRGLEARSRFTTPSR